MSNQIQTFVSQNKREVRFFVLFIVFFSAAQTIYYFLAPVIAPFMQETLGAEASGLLIRLFAPSEQLQVAGNDLIGPSRGALKVGTGCDGIGAMLLLGSAIMAYPASWQRRLAGAACGIAALYLVNLLRIVALYFSWQYHPATFEFLHVYVGQGFIIFTAVLFFILWIGIGEKRP